MGFLGKLLQSTIIFMHFTPSVNTLIAAAYFIYLSTYKFQSIYSDDAMYVFTIMYYVPASSNVDSEKIDVI